MNNKKIIAVLGATGNQGGGLVRAILNDKNSEFHPRAVARDINSEKAQELKRLGAEVVYGNVDDPESIKKAFEGAYGAYCVTFYWEHFSPEKEKEHAKTLADAVKAANLKHVVWSTLEDTRNFVPLDDNRMPTLMEKYKVPHFDAKGESDKYFEESGVPVTFLVASFYWDNFIFFGSGPKKIEDDKYALVFPMEDKKLAGIASEDIGKCAYGVFRDPENYKGKMVGIAGDHLTVDEMAKIMTDKMGKEIVYNPVSADTYRSFGFPGADDLGNMFQFYADFEKEGLELRNLETSRKLNPELKSFDQWVDKYKDKIPME
jgi:uncharacterized protein YbjT (DUF2867 family)